MKDKQVVQLYLKSLGRQIDAAVALKTRFLSEGGSRSSSTLSLRVGNLFHSDDEVQLKTVTAERDELRAKGDNTARIDELTGEVTKLQNEKTQLEQRVQELQTAPPPEATTTVVSAENEAALVRPGNCHWCVSR